MLSEQVGGVLDGESADGTALRNSRTPMPQSWSGKEVHEPPIILTRHPEPFQRDL